MSITKIKRGSVIEDEKGKRYLVVLIGDERLKALDQKFDPVSIGLKWINQFHLIEDVNLDYIIKFLKGD